MSLRRTYVDACVLIAAFQGKDEVSEAAMRILDDPERVFVVTGYLRLETVPKPTYHKKQEEVDFMECFLASAADLIESSPRLTSRAIDFASRYDLGPVDALHISAAVEGGVDEFVTLEKKKKPLPRVGEVPILSLTS